MTPSAIAVPDTTSSGRAVTALVLPVAASSAAEAAAEAAAVAAAAEAAAAVAAAAAAAASFAAVTCADVSTPVEESKLDVVAHPAGAVIVFVSRVTAPFRARSRPDTLAPVVAVILVRAMTVPTIVDPEPRVAELPTCQNTLHGSAPLMSETTLELPVMRVLADWKIQTALGSPAASRVRVPPAEMLSASGEPEP